MLHAHTALIHQNDPSLEPQKLDAVGYVSSATEVLGVLGLTYLFIQSYWNNRRRHLTGRLYYDGLQYGLILEGPSRALRLATHAIERDGRHRIQKKFNAANIGQRHYNDWQMYFDGAQTVAAVLPGYDGAIKENNGQSANQIVNLMRLYQV